jgi:hypothetical protein
MCGSTDERYPVPSPGEHGTIKAANGACANDCDVAKGGFVQGASQFLNLVTFVAFMSEGGSEDVDLKSA